LVGKPTGFLEYDRRESDERLPASRIGDYAEFVQVAPVERLEEQAARCMDCGVPFCQATPPKGAQVAGCPLHNLIPEWNDLVYRGRWREALDRLHATNDFPEFTGRICPAPCEGSCVLSISGESVTIKAIERSIVDRGFAEGWIQPKPPAVRTGRTVGVVGSGPAGLAAAARLNARGHAVTVYERSDRIGGLLTYGIPPMKLDKSLVERRVTLLAQEGVEFRTGVHVGVTCSVAELRERHDALVLAVGALAPRPLDVPGTELPGVHWAMDYLTVSIKAFLDGAPDAGEMDVRQKAVVVIGGGDTGTDCVATALRQGAKSVVQLQHNPQPPDERPVGNPWPQWPRVHRMEYGHEEAAALFGTDPRVFAIQTAAIEGNGRVEALRAVGITWDYTSGSRKAVPVAGTERSIPADRVILAMGFSGPERQLAQALSLPLTERGNFAATDYQTTLPGIFVAGDCRRGQSLVVWAIREGRDAAHACDAWLRHPSCPWPAR
jgi:glutamate synthase (NADPH/NADH) small chain